MVPTTTLSQRFGVVVRNRRLASGITQESLADSAGLHPTYIGMIERGRRNPTLDVCDRIATSLNVSIEILIAEAVGHNERTKR